ncbi:MAG: hypothetical protein QW367_00745 [Candidatus Aenigmatarchaeota archaeon]
MGIVKDLFLFIVLVIIIGAIFIIFLFLSRSENSKLNLNELVRLIILEKTYLAFVLVIIAALAIFIGYSLKKIWLINFGFGILFVGILLIELYVFFTFVGIREGVVGYEVCKELHSSLRLSTISCILMGYKPVNEDAIETASFLIFGIILPFAVIFSVTYGLFFGMGLDKMFGPYGKPVVSIIAFATAMFGMRQLIGPFLIDLLAYGVWGIFGVLIACIITGALRFTILKTFIETEEIKKSIASMFKLYEVDLFDEIDDFIRRVNSVLGKPEKIGEVSDWIERINSYIVILSGIKDKTQDNNKKVKCQTYIDRLEELKGALEGIKKEKEKGGGRQAPSVS